MKLPLARNREVVIQELPEECLIYDLRINKAYCLNKTAAKIFQSCDGMTTFADLNKKYNFPDDLILLSLAELQSANLIQGNTENYFNNLSRRELVRRAGLASLAVLPVISVLIAPTASKAASGQSACTGSNADGSQVTANAGGLNFDNAAAQSACYNALNCRCQSGFAANKTTTLCAGASSARSCSCSGTCAATCVNQGGASAGASVGGFGGGLNFNDAAAQTACLNNLDSKCCSGSATLVGTYQCAGASSARGCSCTGTCA